jgi:hypothetical protein
MFVELKFEYIFTDVNECEKYPCHDNATCVNKIGSFECSCLEGFDGNGFKCLGINQLASKRNCICIAGYYLLD